MKIPHVGIGVAVVIAVPVLYGVAGAEDLVAKGEQVFKANCTACHALPSENRNAFGPSLHGVVGRHAGTAYGYGYSSAMHDSGITWTEEKLDGYLASPKKFVGPIGYRPHPDIKMSFPGLKDADDRQAVIAFLKAN